MSLKRGVIVVLRRLQDRTTDAVFLWLIVVGDGLVDHSLDKQATSVCSVNRRLSQWQLTVVRKQFSTVFLARTRM